MPEVARINKIFRVYKLVSSSRWGEQEFEDLLDLYHKWIRSDLRGVPAPSDPPEVISTRISLMGPGPYPSLIALRDTRVFCECD